MWLNVPVEGDTADQGTTRLRAAREARSVLGSSQGASFAPRPGDTALGKAAGPAPHAPDTHHPHGRRPPGRPPGPGAAGSATAPPPPLRAIARTRRVSQIPRPHGVAVHTAEPVDPPDDIGAAVPPRPSEVRRAGRLRTNIQLGLPRDGRPVRRSGTPTSFRGPVPPFSSSRGRACFSLGGSTRLGPSPHLCGTSPSRTLTDTRSRPPPPDTALAPARPDLPLRHKTSQMAAGSWGPPRHPDARTPLRSTRCTRGDGRQDVHHATGRNGGRPTEGGHAPHTMPRDGEWLGSGKARAPGPILRRGVCPPPRALPDCKSVCAARGVPRRETPPRRPRGVLPTTDTSPGDDGRRPKPSEHTRGRARRPPRRAPLPPAPLPTFPQPRHHFCAGQDTQETPGTGTGTVSGALCFGSKGGTPSSPGRSPAPLPQP